MDNKNNAPSLLKSIEDYDPIFFELFVDQKQVFILDGPEFLAATMLDRDMLAIAVNWYHVGWFCLMTNVYLYLRNSPKIQSRLFHRAVKLR
ncbi:uncharacterized protein LOC118486347 isoform X4 [Helianthus annuus]|uniref:uncharacterized protein LOC118486347 isoform X4 n=1 Tax=Helianthus annuus TaxID=4232 RepID=UPI0016533AF1|nr:uncharacterized protein LOC118486347 isoform X4 [Helianthus annuus]